jgi:cell division protease FtsH
MVTQFGMSEVIGLVAVGDGEHEVFLGRELSQRRQISEHTARLVDQEIKRILDEAHNRARTVLEENRDLLEGIAQALLDRETLDREEIQLLEKGEPLPPPPEPVQEADGNAAEDRPPSPAPPPPLGLPGADGPLPGPAPGFTESEDDADPVS